ncbi:MAG: molecular chaperone [Chlorobiales bacterium]|nr:molecular chaperone [Chlorobiales bacterium]
MKKLLTALLIAAMTSAAAIVQAEEPTPPGQIGVSPSMLELSIGSKPVNESLRIFNLKKTPTKVKVDVYNWTLDENNEVKLLPPTEQSLDQWMLINPTSFVLKPGESQVVRLSIRPTVKPAPGEHRALIYFTEERIDDTPAKAETPVEVLFKLGVGVYANADPTRHSSVLKTLSFDKRDNSLKASISNSGNVHTRLTGTYSIWKKGAFPGTESAEKYLLGESAKKAPDGLVAAGQLNQTPVLPGNTRTIVTQLPSLPAPGSYIVAVSGKLGEKKIEKTYPVSR